MQPELVACALAVALILAALFVHRRNATALLRQRTWAWNMEELIRLISKPREECLFADEHVYEANSPMPEKCTICGRDR